MVPSLPLLSCESSVSVKENPDRKKKKILSNKNFENENEKNSCFNKTSKVLNNENVKTFVNNFHKQFVIVSIDKAANNYSNNYL